MLAAWDRGHDVTGNIRMAQGDVPNLRTAVASRIWTSQRNAFTQCRENGRHFESFSSLRSPCETALIG